MKVYDDFTHIDINIYMYLLSIYIIIHQFRNPWNASPLYTRDPKFDITSPADALAPNTARPTAGTVPTTRLVTCP